MTTLPPHSVLCATTTQPREGRQAPGRASQTTSVRRPAKARTHVRRVSACIRSGMPVPQIGVPVQLQKRPRARAHSHGPRGRRAPDQGPFPPSRLGPAHSRSVLSGPHKHAAHHRGQRSPDRGLPQPVTRSGGQPPTTPAVERRPRQGAGTRLSASHSVRSAIPRAVRTVNAWAGGPRPGPGHSPRAVRHPPTGHGAATGAGPTPPLGPAPRNHPTERRTT